VTSTFLAKNNLKTIFRGHEVFNEGFKIHDSNHQVITVFSAPNYCGNHFNMGAFINIKDKQINV
jgi:serine/threonine-protein phosphatase PP1 catalytic subunit